MGASAQGSNFRGNSVQLQRSAGNNGDIRSLTSIGQCHGAAQSAGPSGHQGDLAFQLHLCFTLLQSQGRYIRLRAPRPDPAHCATTLSSPCQWYCPGLWAFERIPQLDSKLGKVSHIPSDHRHPVNDGRCGDHGVFVDGV